MMERSVRLGRSGSRSDKPFAASVSPLSLSQIY
jgi:hypothetical protein